MPPILTLMAILAAFGPGLGVDLDPTAGPARVVTLGVTVTETALELGIGSQLVATDDESARMPALTAREDHAPAPVGYVRAIAVEALLAQRPGLVLADAAAGPPGALEQLRAAGVPVVVLATAVDIGSSLERVSAMAEALHRPTEGEALRRRMKAGIDAALALPAPGTPPRVMYLYARSPTSIHVGGRGTPVDTMIRLSGAVNAVSFDGYAALTPESAVVAAPDVLLVLQESADSLGGTEALCAQAGLSLTPAGKSRRVVVMDHAMLTGFGPRVGEALARLRTAWSPAGSVCSEDAGVAGQAEVAAADVVDAVAENAAAGVVDAAVEADQ